MKLLRYAYGFRRLKLVSHSSHFVESSGFEDLLVAQLITEVEELALRGLQKTYLARDERLASPRGKIDIQQLALDGGYVTATLPCRHHPRTEDTLLNRVLVAGLDLAESVATNVELRRDAWRLANQIRERVSKVRLSSALLNQTDQQSNRLTKSYLPSLSIIRLLFESRGVMLDGNASSTRLPGFMFDMNAFFQALLSRFLRDNLIGFTLADEQSIKGMMRYKPNFSPPRRPPTPRPDYVVRDGEKTRSILDAKYRDLWEKDLPRSMLYQLVIYALSQPENPKSTILYPTLAPDARPARIEVSNPIDGTPIGDVWIRPVHLGRLETLIEDESAKGRDARIKYANELAFG